MKLCKEISRTPSASQDKSDSNDEWGRTQQSGIHVTGRIVLNLWRIMRSEVKLTMYTLASVTNSVLRRRFPQFAPDTLTRWYRGTPPQRDLVLRHTEARARLCLRLMQEIDMVNRTSELARLFGIDFFSVLSRGSQFRVESLMIRLSRPRNYVAVSPSKQQVANQRAIECLPLVDEPESKLYSDPVIVLDFQSLYPSMIIAYNLCFSTCLGRIETTPKRLGVLDRYEIPPGTLSELVSSEDDALSVSPNQVMFVKPSVRPGVLPRMLREILETRVMVKQAMKGAKSKNKDLYGLLNARQFGLKMIANVTYGYTSASFSGRMPCSDIADSIVQYGRRTLERAIDAVHDNPEWNARVVYGDTDSMFVLCKGASKERAFQIGKEIAERVTALNPPPVKLQFEKVFFPCVLLSKKRYVGYAYESLDQKTPVFDAKGIETIRRDACPAVSKMVEKTLRVLFASKDVSAIKTHVVNQFDKMLSGRIHLQDFVFCKEVRMGTYSANHGSLPPAAMIAKRMQAADPRCEALYSERIPFIVLYNAAAPGPKPRLIDRVFHPDVVLRPPPGQHQQHLKLDCEYYIIKQIIPALKRILSLIGADVDSWYFEMRKATRSGWRGFVTLPNPNQGNTVDNHLDRESASSTRKPTLDFFFGRTDCPICSKPLENNRMQSVVARQQLTGRNAAASSASCQMDEGEVDQDYEALKQLICASCQQDPQAAAYAALSRSRNIEKQLALVRENCMDCMSTRILAAADACASLDCPAMFLRFRLRAHAMAIQSAFGAFGMQP